MARKAKRTTKKRTTKRTTSRKKPATRRTSTKKRTTKKKTATRKKTTRKASTKKAAPKKAAKPQIKKIKTAIKPKNARTKSYTQAEFFENVRGFCGLEKRSEAKELCNDIALFLTDSLKKGYKVPLLGLGKLYVRRTKARMGRNPATGEPIHISAKKRVRFSPAKALKEAVL